MVTDNQDVARLLYELGALSERLDDRSRRFRANAYRRAAATIAGLTDDVLTLSVKDLTALPGVGAGTAARLDELRRTGRIARLEHLRSLDPYGAEELLRVPGLGPTTVARLRDALGVRDVAGLRAALDAEQVRTVRGSGPVTERRLREALRDLDLDRDEPGLPIADAVGHAARLGRMIGGLDGVASVSWAGDLGRMMDTVAMIDLVVSAASPAAVVRAATRLPAVRETLDVRGSVVTLQTFDGPRARVAAAPPSRLGAVLVHATAAAGHWRGLQRVAASRAMQLTSEGLLGPERERARRGRT